MVRNFIFLFFLESIILCYKNEDELALSNLLLSVNNSIINLFSTINSKLSNKCSKEIEKNFKNSDFYNKFLLDSSKNKNDLMSFFYCTHRNSITNNSKNLDSIYIIIINYEYLNNTYLQRMIYPRTYVIGLCLPKNKDNNCNDNDYKQIIRQIFDLRFELFQINISNNKLETIILNKNEKTWPDNKFDIFSYPKIFNFIPFLLIVIQIIFCIFPSIPKKLIYCINFSIFCCKKSQNVNYSNLFSQIKKHFTFSENIDELYSSSKINSKINNDSGIKYIIGIRGINIIMMIIGTVFQTLINSPTHIYSYIYLGNLMQNYSYGFIFYGVRYAPRILFSCSGFILSFKLLFFFEDKVDEIKERKNKNNKNYSLDLTKSLSSLSKYKPKEEINISIYYPLRFITYQLHKYFVYIFIIIFSKYSMYYLQNSVTPIWKYLYNSILLKTTYLHLIFQFILIRPFLFDFSYPLKEENNTKNAFYDNLINSIFLDYYWIISNEIILFIFGVFYIYFFVKLKKYSLNYSLFFIFIFILAFKNIIWYLGFSTNEYLSHYGYGQMFISPLFNIPYYLIGIYFGFVNYIFEKRINTEIVINQNKIYLKGPSYQLKTFLTTKSKIGYKMIWMVYILIIIFSLSQIIIYNNSNTIKESLILKIFYLFDIELLVYYYFLATMFHFIRGNSIIYSFLTFKFWIRFHKLYFSYLVILPTVSIYFLYQSESRITLSFSNVIFYSVIIWIITDIISSLLFISTEMPYKKVIKLLFLIRDKELENENKEIEEEQEQIPL